MIFEYVLSRIDYILLHIINNLMDTYFYCLKYVTLLVNINCFSVNKNIYSPKLLQPLQLQITHILK